MKDQIIEFETAKLAKSKGFHVDNFYYFYSKPASKMFGIDEHGRAYPIKNERKKLYTIGHHASLHDESVFRAVSQSLLQRWLREKHDIHIVMRIENTQDDFDEDDNDFYCASIYVGKIGFATDLVHVAKTYLDYETELEIALRKSLKLIKKNQIKMGAITKEDSIQGRDLRTAFKELQDSDREDLGNDYYSGGWNNAQGVVEVSRTKFNSGEPSKHEPAWALCTQKPVGNDMKIKTKVTNYPAKGTRQWVTKYEVEHPVHGNIIISELKQGEAIKKARKLVEQNPDWDLSVFISKRLKSSSRVADIEYKKSSKERDGRWDVKGTLAY